MKIKNKIILSFLGLFTLIMILVGVATGVTSAQIFRQEVENNLSALTESRANHIKTLLSSEKEETIMMAASQVLRDFLKTQPGTSDYKQQEERSKDRLKRTIQANDEIEGFSLLDKTGKVLLSTDEAILNEDKSKDEIFIKGQNGVFITDIHYSEGLKKNLYTVSAPINDDQTGNLLGVIVARYNPNEISEILEKRAGLGRTGENFLVNSNKYFLTPSLYLGQKVVLKQKVETQNVQDCFDAQEINTAKTGQDIKHNHELVRRYQDYRGVEILGTHSYIPATNWCLIGKIDYSEVNQPAVYQMLIFTGVFLLSALSYVLISLLISKRISDPIEKLHHGTEIIEKGNLDYKIGINSKDEIGQLSRSFDQMVSSIKQSRLEVDRKVKEQTKEIIDRSQDMEDQRKAILNILEDVEDEKNKVSGEKDKINAILHSIGDGVFVVDRNLKIVLMNDVASGLCGGYKPEEAIGKNYFDIFKFVYEDKKDKVNDVFIKDVISTGQPKSMANHTVLIRPDGTMIAVADSAAPLKDGNGRVIGCVVVFRDVTIERQIDRQKDEFVSIASHELRTPMTAIKGLISMIFEGDYGEINDKLKDPLHDVSISVDRLISLINNMLNVSRIEMGRLQLNFSNLKIADIIEEVVRNLSPIAKEKGIELLVDNKTVDNNIVVQGDVDKVNQILNNLIGNSLKFTEKGSISLSTKAEGEFIKVFVRDTGLGIDNKDKDKLFVKFQQLNSDMISHVAGSGLGLYISRELARKMGGDLWIEKSELGVGSTFAFSIPKENTALAREIKAQYDKEYAKKT